MHETVSSQWHPTRNAKSFDDTPTYRNKESSWWVCSLGHEYECKKEARVVKGVGCPFCSGRKVLPGFNDIASKHPDWVSFWSPSNEKSPSEVLSGGREEFSWLCEKGHEFSSSVGHKERGRGCPFCSNQKVLTGFNDLASLFPELAAEWHPTKNGDKSPDMVIAGGRSKFWWVGACGHEWETHIRRRVEGSGCHVCANQKVVSGVNDLASQFPAVTAEWHPTRNDDISPDKVMFRSGAEVWWLCSEGHEWKSKVANRTLQNNGCNVCKQNARNLTVKQDSLADYSPSIAAEWHPTKNGAVSPGMVSRGASRNYWWLCKEGHEWAARVDSRTIGRTNCPFCAGIVPTPGVNDLASVYPDIASQWHSTLNSSKPNEILKSSNKTVWWLCNKGHSYEMSVTKRTLDGRNCPVCSGHKVVAGVNDLSTENPNLAAEWHPTKNGTVTPETVTGKGGRVRAWWICSEGHEYESGVKSRVRGRGCPQCWANSFVSRVEAEIYETIRSLLPEGITVLQSDRKLLKGRELDIYIPDKKLAVEFNGLFWHTEAAGKNPVYHRDKWLKAKQVGVQLVQVWEDDYRRNPELVKRMLAHKLGVSQERTVYARKTVVDELEKKEAEAFLNENHVQGYASGSHYVGLKDTSGVVVSVLVLKKESNVYGDGLNIIRYATSCNVVGGFTKLLAYAERSYAPEFFVTFADHCVSDGGLYENNGFVVDKILPPDYMYVVGGERKHKFGYRIKRFKDDPDLLFEEGLTEKQLAELNGLERIWDAGKTRFVKYVS